MERMDVERSHLEEIAREHLIAAGFDVNSPDPRVAWTAFKSFARRNIPRPRTITIGYEAYQAADRDRTLWLSFMRSVEMDAGVGWHAGYLFSRSSPDSLIGVADQNWWWAERLTLDAWFEEVEANPVFRECLALDAWSWEGFSD